MHIPKREEKTFPSLIRLRRVSLVNLQLHFLSILDHDFRQPLTNASSPVALATCQLVLGGGHCLGLGVSRLCASCMHHSWDYSVETVLNPQTAVHTAVPARKQNQFCKTSFGVCQFPQQERKPSLNQVFLCKCSALQPLPCLKEGSWSMLGLDPSNPLLTCCFSLGPGQAACHSRLVAWELTGENSPQSDQTEEGFS